MPPYLAAGGPAVRALLSDRLPALPPNEVVLLSRRSVRSELLVGGASFWLAAVAPGGLGCAVSLAVLVP
jgi:hypothetical protein